MTKVVLSVGQCLMDHETLSGWMAENFDIEVVAAQGKRDTLSTMRERDCHLVLVNRIIDCDGTSGLDIIAELKNDPELSAVPVMMVTNYPDHQQLAVEAGAEYGFGKANLGAEAVGRLRPFLS